MKWETYPSASAISPNAFSLIQKWPSCWRSIPLSYIIRGSCSVSSVTKESLPPGIAQVISKLCLSWVSHLAVAEERRRIVAKFVLERLRQRLSVCIMILWSARLVSKARAEFSPSLEAPIRGFAGIWTTQYTVCLAPLYSPCTTMPSNFTQDQIAHINSFVNVNSFRCNVPRANVDNFRVLCDHFPARATKNSNTNVRNINIYI